METLKDNSCKKHLNFLVLLPHVDSQKLIHDHRQELFCNGFLGAYSFPIAAPLAILSRPLKIEEIKKISAETRKLTLKNEGKITTSSLSLARCPDIEHFSRLSFYGPLFDIPFQEILMPINDKIFFLFPEPVICSALYKGDELPPTSLLKPFSFRAARIAILAIRPLKSGLKSYSFEWQLNRAVWLPKWRGNK